MVMYFVLCKLFKKVTGLEKVNNVYDHCSQAVAIQVFFFFHLSLSQRSQIYFANPSP